MRRAAAGTISGAVSMSPSVLHQTRYTVHMAELNGGYVMSRYNVPGGVSSIDSDLTRSESGLPAVSARPAGR